MGFMDFIKSAGGALNNVLKQSKLISTVAPNLPIPFASQIGKVAGNLGYAKGGRILKKVGMKKGGKVGRPKKAKAPTPTVKKPRGRPRKVKAM
jgi:hypothetical protein